MTGTSECLTFCFKDDEQKHPVWSTEHSGKHEAAIRKKSSAASSFFLQISELFRQALRLSQPLLLRQIIACYVRHSSPSWYQRGHGAACSGRVFHPELHHDRERIKIALTKKFLFHLVSQHISTDSDLNGRNNTISGNSCVYRVWKGLSECSIHTNLTFSLTTSIFHHHIQHLCSCKHLENKPVMSGYPAQT